MPNSLEALSKGEDMVTNVANEIVQESLYNVVQQIADRIQRYYFHDLVRIQACLKDPLMDDVPTYQIKVVSPLSMIAQIFRRSPKTRILLTIQRDGRQSEDNYLMVVCKVIDDKDIQRIVHQELPVFESRSQSVVEYQTLQE